MELRLKDDAITSSVAIELEHPPIDMQSLPKGDFEVGGAIIYTQASSYLTSESLDMYFIYLVLKLPSRFLAVSSLKLEFLPHNLNLNIEHVGSSNVSRTHGNFL
jgi:hypothetical protein